MRRCFASRHDRFLGNTYFPYGAVSTFVAAHPRHLQGSHDRNPLSPLSHWVWVNTYRYIFSGLFTSIYQLFWGSLGTRVLTHPHLRKKSMRVHVELAKAGEFAPGKGFLVLQKHRPRTRSIFRENCRNSAAMSHMWRKQTGRQKCCESQS